LGIYKKQSALIKESGNNDCSSYSVSELVKPQPQTSVNYAETEPIGRNTYNFSEISSYDPASEKSEMGVLMGNLGCSSGGVALDGKTRGRMENDFGYNFGSVRVHTDSYAVNLTNALNANATCYGQDIYFGKNKFVPNTQEGTNLLKHELTHYQQQTQTGTKKIQNSSNSETPSGGVPESGDPTTDDAVALAKRQQAYQIEEGLLTNEAILGRLCSDIIGPPCLNALSNLDLTLSGQFTTTQQPSLIPFSNDSSSQLAPSQQGAPWDPYLGQIAKDFDAFSSALGKFNTSAITTSLGGTQLTFKAIMFGNTEVGVSKFLKEGQVSMSTRALGLSLVADLWKNPMWHSNFTTEFYFHKLNMNWSNNTLGVYSANPLGGKVALTFNIADRLKLSFNLQAYLQTTKEAPNVSTMVYTGGVQLTIDHSTLSNWQNFFKNAVTK